MSDNTHAEISAQRDGDVTVPSSKLFNQSLQRDY